MTPHSSLGQTLASDPAPAIAAQAIMVDAPLSGTVARILVTDGQRVHKGQVLVELDSTPITAEIKNLEFQLAQAKAETRQAVAAVPFSGEVGDRNAAPMGVPSGAIIGRISGTAIDLSRFQNELAKAQKNLADVKAAEARTGVSMQRGVKNLDAIKARVASAGASLESAKGDLREAQAAIDVAVAKRTKAKGDSDRFETLYKDGVVSRNESTKVTAKYLAAQDAEAVAREHAKSAAEDVDSKQSEVESATKDFEAAKAAIAKDHADSGGNSAQVKLAQLAVQQAQAKLESAKATARRTRVQGEDVASALAQVGTAPVPVQVKPIPKQVTQQKVEKIEALLESAKTLLAQTQIVAPSDGIVRLNGLVPHAKVVRSAPILSVNPKAP